MPDGTASVGPVMPVERDGHGHGVVFQRQLHAAEADLAAAELRIDAVDECINTTGIDPALMAYACRAIAALPAQA